MVLLRLAGELGARGLLSEDLQAAVERVRMIVQEGEEPPLEPPERVLVLVGSGPATVSAREGALKLREGARVLAEGYGGEYLLHGCAAPLDERDVLLLLAPTADRDGLVTALGQAARAEGLVVASIDEPSIAHPVLAQLPIIVSLQLLALSFSTSRSTDPDTAIIGHWADEAMWEIGRPTNRDG
jgi:glucosamine--fructose-6-phosphate aminotransferase (isomerizing)